MIRQLLTLVCLVGAAMSIGQTLTTNELGQRVIVYPDGTTRLFDEASAEGQTQPRVIGTATPQQEQDARKAIEEQLDVLKDEFKSLTSIAKKARGQEAKLSNRIRKLRDSKKSSDRSQIEIVNQKLITARDEYQTAEAARTNNRRLNDALAQTLGMTIGRRQAYLSALNLGYLVGTPEGLSAEGNDIGQTALATSLPTATASPEPSGGGRRNRNPTNSFVAYDPANDTRFNPPTAECRLESEGIDEFTNSKRVALKPEVFFTYTSPELKPFLGDASLLTCNARLVKSGKSLILETEFVIRSQFAAKEFGVLPKGSQMTFRTVEAQKVVMRNQSASQASYDPVTKVSTYRGRYVVSRGARKTLERAMLDEVRVMWGTGFDDYQIYDLTFLKRQLACL